MGEGEAEGGTVFCLKGGEEEVAFSFSFFFMCCVLSSVGHSSSSSTSFEFFSGIIFFLLSFALYLPSKLETAYHHTHTLSPMAFSFFFFLFSDPVSIVSKERKKNSSILRSCRHVI